jgi:hypothetical protein
MSTICDVLHLQEGEFPKYGNSSHRVNQPKDLCD